MARLNSKDIGQAVRQARRNLGVTQKAVALTCATGLRFVGELEQGKPTCQLGKVLNTLNVRLTLELPPLDPRPKVKRRRR
jgi:HTH-type transcriptional regulator / antitoxin HipB